MRPRVLASLASVGVLIASVTATSPVRLVQIATSAAVSTDLATRLAGVDRYDTAAAIAAEYSPGVPAIYIATGLSYPDALAAGPAAGTASPVLLVAGAAIPASVTTQVQRLKPGKVILIGGPSALPDSVGAALGQYATNGWTRLSGADRYATAAAVSAATFNPGVSVAYLATGANFPDALTGSALGAMRGGPVLLTDSTSLSAAAAAELARLHPAEIDILGGTQVVSAAAQSALGSYSAVVKRFSGSNRYDTNVLANESLSGSGSGSGGSLIVATGANFPDALAGAALAGHLGREVLLVGSGGVSANQTAFITRYAPQSLIVLGGQRSISDAVVTNVLVAAGLQTAPPGNAADYVLSYTDDGQLVRWNPCRTIGWKLNAPGVPQATIGLVTQAFSDLSEASGLTFRYDGSTTFVPTHATVDSEPDDIIVALLPAANTDLFNGFSGADGVGGISYLMGPGTPLQIQHGYAYLDADALPGFSSHVDQVLVLHELGHAVGLRHAAFDTEIMYPVASDASPDDYGAGDRAGLAKIGAAAGCIS